MDNIIKWNTDKHDDKVFEAQKKRVKIKVAHIYEAWKKELCRGRKTWTEVTEAIYNLQAQLRGVLELEGLKEYRDFTLDLLDDAVARWTAANMSTQNVIVEYVPFDEGKKIIPKAGKFITQEQFVKIEFVEAFTQKPNFVGFVVGFPIVYGLFEDGELLPVGSVINDNGLRGYPSLQQFISNSSAATNGESPASPESSEPGSSNATAPSPANPEPSGPAVSSPS